MSATSLCLHCTQDSLAECTINVGVDYYIIVLFIHRQISENVSQNVNVNFLQFMLNLITYYAMSVKTHKS